MIEVQQMPRKKTNPDDWLPAQSAADIISENSGHAVSAAYVRKLGNQGKIETWTVNSRLKLYKRSGVNKIRVVEHQRKEAR
jgi:hypothetical protein